MVMIQDVIKRKLKFLVTAGPTVEDIDPVRFLSNRSSGKMGYELARTVIRAGHCVTLVSGPTSLTSPKGCRHVAVRSARDMLKAVLKHFRQSDIIIKAAAVADYRPQKKQLKKIKKKQGSLKIHLVKNPDILKILGSKKNSSQLLVGFAAETDNIMRHARKKMIEKKLDWIAINNVSRQDIGFLSDNNELILMAKNGGTILLPKQSKTKLSAKMIKIFVSDWQQKNLAC